MKSKWSSSWKSSVQPRRQRKYVYNAPVHVRRKVLLSANLSPELRKKIGTRSVEVRTGDEVVVKRGAHKGKSGKVVGIVLKKGFKGFVHVEGIEGKKQNGQTYLIPLRPSNLQIVRLNLDDPKRFKRQDVAAARAKEKEREEKKEAKAQKKAEKEEKQEKKEEKPSTRASKKPAKRTEKKDSKKGSERK